MNRHPWRSLAVLFASLSLATTSCILWSTKQIGVSVGKGLYVRIYQKATDQVEFLYQFHGRDAARVLREMRTRVHFEDDLRGKIAAAGYGLFDVKYFFDPVQVNDFREALGRVRGTNKCLMMHRNPVNYLPGADRHNWTTSTPPGECRVGQPFPITA